MADEGRGGDGLPEAVLFSALSDVTVKDDGEDDDQDDGHRGATCNAGPLQQDLFPESCTWTTTNH